MDSILPYVLNFQQKEIDACKERITLLKAISSKCKDNIAISKEFIVFFL